jgi:hypothetical protein
MHLSQHVVHSLFSSTEFWAAIIGALIGAVIGGLFAVLAQFLSTLWQRKSERDAEARMLIGVLQVIETEVELFKVLWLDAFKLAFKAHLPKVASLPQSLVIVFDSNAAMLGHVADAALRRKIVKTYAKIKAMIGVVSHYAARRESWESIRYQSSPGGGINERQAEVETWSDNLRRNIPELEIEIEDLLAHIRKYLDSLKVPMRLR